MKCLQYWSFIFAVVIATRTAGPNVAMAKLLGIMKSSQSGAFPYRVNATALRCCFGTIASEKA